MRYQVTKEHEPDRYHTFHVGDIIEGEIYAHAIKVMIDGHPTYIPRNNVVEADTLRSTNEYENLYPGPIDMKYKGYDCQQFNIRVTMNKRWIPHFLAMLKYMQYLGGVGGSRKITFYADGDGDFRPAFNWSDLLPSDAKPIEDHDGDRFYDAG